MAEKDQPTWSEQETNAEQPERAEIVKTARARLAHARELMAGKLFEEAIAEHRQALIELCAPEFGAQEVSDFVDEIALVGRKAAAQRGGQKGGKKGGKIRAASMTLEERSRGGKKGGKVRAASMTLEERSRGGKKGAAARWKKVREKSEEQPTAESKADVVPDEK